MAAAPSAPPSAPTRDALSRKAALASAAGATIEWYDFFLYGTAASLVFNRLFFTGMGSAAGTLAAFATFAAGFVARPVGGLLFGHFGDRIGRKRMLLVTMTIMGGSTTVIGLLPTYDAIGVWAPLLLVAMRVLQGVGVGGEYGGAVLMAVEYAPPGRRSFYGSFAHVGVPAGLLLAAGAFTLVSLLPEQAFLQWGWRATFVASVLLLAVGAYIRMSVLETPAFDATRRSEGCCACRPSRSGAGTGVRWCWRWAPAGSRASSSTCGRCTCCRTPPTTSAWTPARCSRG